MREPVDHDDRHAERPRKPRQAATEPDKKIGMQQHFRAVLQRSIASEILGAFGHGVREFIVAILPVPVNAQDSISQRFQMVDQDWPSVRIVPILTLLGQFSQSKS